MDSEEIISKVKYVWAGAVELPLVIWKDLTPTGRWTIWLPITIIGYAIVLCFLVVDCVCKVANKGLLHFDIDLKGSGSKIYKMFFQN